MEITKQRIIDKIQNSILPYFENNNGAHDLDHTLRVLKLCLHIGEIEGADLFVLNLAALLHDIARSEEDESQGKVCHAKRGALIAEEILRELSLDPGLIAKVCHCIITHRFRNAREPETLEAKVLFDADKLDSIGASGIGRAFLFAGSLGAPLHIKDLNPDESRPYSKEDTAFREFKVKLSKVKDRIYTNEGKRISIQRHEFMVNFFSQLDREFAGEF
jgi:uncharacterized protein